MVAHAQLTIRTVRKKDRPRLANMIHFETYVHRHLDWRPPLDWIGSHPYVVAEKDNRIIAALACPPDPPGVAWVRMFVCSSRLKCEDAWEILWPQALERLTQMKAGAIAAIPLQKWFRLLLGENGFEHIHNVIVFAWDNLPAELPDPKPVSIRPMIAEDLPAVQAVDENAFGPIWRNSLESVQLAFDQSVYATVAEDDGGLTGYQISTPSPYGAHLARLAVHPRAQKQGVGYALLRQLQFQFQGRQPMRLTVNTQDDNQASIALYTKAGFAQTNEAYPVFLYPLSE